MKPPAGLKGKITALAAGLLCLLVGGIGVWSAQERSFSRWVSQDPGRIMPYGEVLLGNGSAPTELIDVALADHLAHGRLVHHLSRSEYRRGGILGTSRWARVCLGTHKPGEPETVSWIRLLVRLDSEGGRWRVGYEQTLALP